MEEQNAPQKQPQYKYEPGELDKTRKNIGTIGQEEALKMTKILGGEIGLEKSAPIDEAMLKKVRTAIQTKDLRNGERRNRRTREQPAVAKPTGGSASSTDSGQTEEKTTSRRDILPVLSSKERAKIDKLMMSPDYRIKQNYGIFNFIAALTKNGHEKVMPSFITITLKAYLLRIQNLHMRVKELVAITPESYRGKIGTDDDIRCRFLKTVSNWPMQETESLYHELEQNANNANIAMMIPFVRNTYKILLSIYFMGENKSVELLQSIAQDLNQYPDVAKDRVQAALKDISTEWLYVYSRVTRGMYPLLLRMCSQEFMEFQPFITKQISKIFGFLGITKYDVLLPTKKSPVAAPVEPQQPQKTEEQINKENAQRAAEQKEAELIQSGLKVLDKIFPGAGWLSIDQMPDMYPFYQPLYNFPDGLNLVSPQNPLQIIIILIKIIEDLLEGCRNIGFPDDHGRSDTVQTMSDDSIMQIMNDWSAYREIVFDKMYVPYLKDYVNKLYSQKDFTHTQYGKRLISNMQWHTFYNYLPHMKFEQLLLEKPSNESKMRPLSLRTALLVTELRRITAAADSAARNNTTLQELPTIFEPYKFDIPNIVSQRIDVMLGAKRHKEGGRATNLNLLKYTLAAVSVLNWWISDKNSPAYATSDIPVCRLAEDGSPIFSVQGRTDQNALFVQSMKAAASKVDASKQS